MTEFIQCNNHFLWDTISILLQFSDGCDIVLFLINTFSYKYKNSL
jgi:hypothetical protein